MKKNIIILLVSLAVLFAILSFKQDKKEPENTQTTYSSKELGFEFSYKTGQDGYIVEESDPKESEVNLLKKITLVQKKDVGSVATEGPATISISVLKNNKNRQPGVWAMENPDYSNYNLKLTEPEEMVVGGANAVKYKADGLYTSNKVIVAHAGYIYVLTGMYLDENSDLSRDFPLIVDSVKFIPISPTNVGGKINIDEVCNSALAYMTFPDAKSTEEFLKECKEGNRPEVIEKFKKDMGLGEGVAI